jgi:endogenous inhibitor of DNA gyrase (YacG/DUF329 family)
MKKTTTCECCGIIGTVPEVFHYGYAECRKCGKDKKAAKIKALLNRQCKVCGKLINLTDPRQITCSRECGHAHRRKEKIMLKCEVCGKSVERHENWLTKHKTAACSISCQNVIFARGAANTSALKLLDTKSLRVKSLRAKVKWYKAQSKKRAANGWHRVLVNWSRQRHGPTKEKSWDDKLRSMMMCNRHREALSVVSELNHKPKQKRRRGTAWVDKWNEACSEMILLFNRKRKNDISRDPWDNKLMNWQGNHRRRVKEKSHRSQLKDCEAY